MDERNRPTLAQQLRQATAQAPRQQKALAAFATLYVIEGSTNGGQIISQRLQRTSPHLSVHCFNVWQKNRAVGKHGNSGAPNSSKKLTLNN